MLKKLFTTSIALMLVGCATDAPERMDVLSKGLKPESDKALIYVFKPFGCNAVAIVPIRFNDESVGTIGLRQYVYAYAKPAVMMTRAENGGALNVNIEAGKTYYLKLKCVLSFSHGMSWAFEQLPPEEGRNFLTDFRLSGDFKKTVIAPTNSGNTLQLGGDVENNPSAFAWSLTVPSITLLPPEDNQAGHVDASNAIIENYLEYDDKTKVGTIKYLAKIEERDLVFKKIGDVCNTKNVALRSGSASSENGAVYTTLDEKFTNSLFSIKFKCLY